MKKNTFKSLTDIRKFQYKYKIEKSKKLFKVEVNNFYKNPYTFLKSVYYIESSSLIVFFSQFTKITPNQLTFIYIVLGIIGCFFLASNNDILIITGSFFFFTKGSFDWADGTLAKFKRGPTEIGNLLDNWGALVGQYSFLTGLGLYVYNKENEIIFILFTLLIMFLKVIDIKSYSYQLFSIELEKAKNKKNFLKKINFGHKYYLAKRKKSFIYFIKEFFRSFVDDRARTIDFILLLVLVDNFYFDVFFLKYIFFYIVFKAVAIFFGKIYITLNKKNSLL